MLCSLLSCGACSCRGVVVGVLSMNSWLWSWMEVAAPSLVASALGALGGVSTLREVVPVEKALVEGVVEVRDMVVRAPMTVRGTAAAERLVVFVVVEVVLVGCLVPMMVR